MISKINPTDFFCFLEMIDRNIELKMNESTYKKIIGTTFGIKDYSTITNIIPNINGVKIDFDNSMKNDLVTITAKYIPRSRDSFNIEIT